MDNVDANDYSEDEFAEDSNKENCEEIEDRAYSIFNKFGSFVYNAPAGYDNEAAISLVNDSYARLQVIRSLLDVQGPLTIASKERISGNMATVLEFLDMVADHFPLISQHSKKQNDRVKAAKARKGRRDKSSRNEEIFRLALVAGAKVPTLANSPNSMAEKILPEVNTWIKANCAGKEIKTSSIYKVLSRNRESWKVK